jgi:hypothetical protein
VGRCALHSGPGCAQPPMLPRVGLADSKETG